MQRFSIIALATGLFLSSVTNVVAQPGRDKEELSWDRNINRLFSRYCNKCHNADAFKGDVNLEQDKDLKMVLDHRDTWLKVGDQLEFGAMPPENSRQPSAHEAELMSQFIDTMVRKIECNDLIRPGKPISRRLNRYEYQNTINALSGWKVDWSERISPDPIAYGFDNIGEVMALSDTQLQQFDDLATEIIDRAFDNPTSLKVDSPLHQLIFESNTEFATLPVDQADALASSRIEQFASIAFRRPLTPEQSTGLTSVYLQARRMEETPRDALAHTIHAILISPRFLFRIEKSQPDIDEPYLVDKYDLISRLSFFLWASAPDSKLMQYAATHDLDSFEEVGQLAEIMIADERVRHGLVDRFFLQWLRLADLESHTVDTEIFADFDNSLIGDMKQEVSETILQTIQNDGTVNDLLSSDSVYVTSRLAKFYGLQSQFSESQQQSTSNLRVRKIDAGNSGRGGLLTSAAVLLATADPNRTNVPRRGNYVAGVFFGDPPPPPPPGVPELEAESESGKSLTLREKLEQHRANPECASCHAKMDPIGFALENFDAVGRWRTHDNGKLIDASGELVTGESFNDTAEFKQIVLDKSPQITNQLVKQMLTYALGRGLSYTDECTINSVLEAYKENDQHLSAIVNAIVTSDVFRYRINPEF